MPVVDQDGPIDIGQLVAEHLDRIEGDPSPGSHRLAIPRSGELRLAVHFLQFQPGGDAVPGIDRVEIPGGGDGIVVPSHTPQFNHSGERHVPPQVEGVDHRPERAGECPAEGDPRVEVIHEQWLTAKPPFARLVDCPHRLGSQAGLIMMPLELPDRHFPLPIGHPRGDVPHGVGEGTEGERGFFDLGVEFHARAAPIGRAPVDQSLDLGLSLGIDLVPDTPQFVGQRLVQRAVKAEILGGEPHGQPGDAIFVGLIIAMGGEASPIVPAPAGGEFPFFPRALHAGRTAAEGQGEHLGQQIGIANADIDHGHRRLPQSPRASQPDSPPNCSLDLQRIEHFAEGGWGGLAQPAVDGQVVDLQLVV